MGIWTIVGIAIVGIGAIVGVLMALDIIRAPMLEDYEWSEHETRGPA
jgi:hypothetical protein